MSGGALPWRASPDGVTLSIRLTPKGGRDCLDGVTTLSDGTPQCRSDGCVKASRVPAGFLKLTRNAIDIFMTAYPNLTYGPKSNPSVDLFNHGAHNGVWYGEDYAFSRNWEVAGGEIWIVPDLNIDHHYGNETFKGNFHQYLKRLPART